MIAAAKSVRAIENGNVTTMRLAKWKLSKCDERNKNAQTSDCCQLLPFWIGLLCNLVLRCATLKCHSIKAKAFNWMNYCFFYIYMCKQWYLNYIDAACSLACLLACACQIASVENWKCLLCVRPCLCVCVCVCGCENVCKHANNTYLFRNI